MTAIDNSIGLSGPIAPFDDTDTYATHFAKYGKGGYYPVDDIIARDNISAERLEEGLLVKVLSDGKYYSYSGSTWIEEAFSNGGTSLTYEVKNVDFIAVPNFIYGVDTTAGVVVATMPAGVAGDQIHFTDARYTFGTNKLTLNGASGETIAGLASVDLDRHRDTISLVYDAVASDWVIWGTEASKATGGSAGSSLTYQIKSADFVTVRDHIYGVDTSTLAITVDLGVVPNGGIVHISDITGYAETHNITIVPTTGTVSGETTLQLTKDFECVSWVYDATNDNWVIWGTESSGTAGGGGASNRIYNGDTEAVISVSNGPISFNIAGGNNGSITASNVMLGYDAGKFNVETFAFGQPPIGLWAASGSGRNNVFLGLEAGYNNTYGNNNNFIGLGTGYGNTVGTDNICIGTYSGYSLTTGSDNICLGTDSGGNITTGELNIFIGDGSGLLDGAVSRNIALGVDALNGGGPVIPSQYSNSNSSWDNIALGTGALYTLTTGFDNVALGRLVLSKLTTGSFNVAVGFEALLQVTSGFDNIGIGNHAGSLYTTGSNNIHIGSYSGALTTSDDVIKTSYDNTINLGYLCPPATASNQITLGNSSITALRCQVTSITSLSDRRDKTNIVTLPLGLDFVKTLNPVKFDWDMRDGAKVNIPDYGFIAQDLQEAQQGNEWLDLVLDNNPDKLEATPGKLIPVLVKAIQELNDKVESLTQQLEVYKNA